MTLREEFKTALKSALVEQNKVRASTIRLIIAALKDRDIAARDKGNSDGISESEILQMLQSMIKQRHDSITMYEQGGRIELASREKAEIEIVQSFLPKQMDEDEVKAVISNIIAENNATSIKDMGQVMSVLRQRYAGQLDFGKASQTIKQLLVAA